jgi:hydroxymethylpyrimidine pyrophosphatase-like HAD family hydrolase
VAREAETVRFDPQLATSYESLTDDVVKIVGVSDDTAAVDQAGDAARNRFGHSISAAASQPYYLDVTHPDANKGAVVKYLADYYHIAPAQIATIGDMANDVLMFAHSGLSIAMGNASADVKRAARRVTGSNEADGFAEAVRRFILPTKERPDAPLR